MPYKTIRAFLTVPSEHAEVAHEIIDRAIDQLIIENIPVSDTEVTEECADPPHASSKLRDDEPRSVRDDDVPR